MNTHPSLMLLSGKPVRGDLEAAPVGAFDVIRDDIRIISTVKPVDRIHIERTETGYRGILFSNENPHMFALNGNGFLSKPVEDGTDVLRYCTTLEENERRVTSLLDERRADAEMEEFNAEMDNGMPHDKRVDARQYANATTAIAEQGPAETIAVWGPTDSEDPVERIPGAFRLIRRSQLEGKQSKRTCGGAVIVDKDGRVLLIKPRNGFGGYDWTFPKGHPTIEDTTSAITAQREALEETGYTVHASRLIGRFTHNDGGVCDYHECLVDTSKPRKPYDEFETAETRWVSVIEALELLNDDVDVRILTQANNLAPKLLLKGGHTGTMVSLHLPNALAKKLALPGGEDPGDLHITIAYLGKGLSDAQKKAAASVVRRFAETVVDGIKVTLSGVGRFSASTTSDGKDVVYVSADSPALTRMRPRLIDMFADAGIIVSETHGFTPHVTLAYIDKTDKTPLERFEPIELKFEKISLTIANKQMSFALKLSPQNQKLHDTAVRNYEALLKERTAPGIDLRKSLWSDLFKARNVKNPGSRGGKLWIDDSGNARYDERPKGKKPKKTLKKVEGATANRDTIYVHTNKMGVRFLRDSSEHAEDGEDAATVRYAPFGKNVDGLTQGEIHFVFDELFNSQHATMDEFLNDKIAPVWDDKDGADPYTMESARTWMEHALHYLEYDNAVAPGGKDIIRGRKDVDWKALHEALRDLPRTDQEALAPHKRRCQKEVRDGLRTILSHFGITKPPMGAFLSNGQPDSYAGHERICGSSNERDIGQGKAAAFHDWQGVVHLNEHVHKGVIAFAKAMVDDTGELPNGDSIYAMRCALHEELHGFSEMMPWAYRGVGAFVEEIATEVVARRVMRERFGHLRDTSVPGMRTMNGPGVMARGDNRYMEPSGGGSYGTIIAECAILVAEVLHEDYQNTRTAGMPDRNQPSFLDEAKHKLEEACLMLKAKHWGVESRNDIDHLATFVNCFKTLRYGVRDKIGARIEQLIEGKIARGQDARHEPAKED